MMPSTPVSSLPHVAEHASRQIFTQLQRAGCRPKYVSPPTGETMLVMSRATRCQRLYQTLAGHASVPTSQLDLTR